MQKSAVKMAGSKSRDSRPVNEEIQALERALEENPEAPDFERLADLYSRKGRFEDAVRLCRDGLERHPGRVKGMVALGRALFGQGDLGGAVQVLRRAIARDPRQTEAYRLLGEILLRQQNATEAVSLLGAAGEHGAADERIASLLRRAQQALELQRTQIRKLPDQQLDRTPTPASPEELWAHLHSRWEKQLDASASAVQPHTDSDVRLPFRSERPVELQLPPLSDPLAEGMPPLPPETSEMMLPPVDATEETPAPEMLPPPGNDVASLAEEQDPGDEAADEYPMAREAADDDPLAQRGADDELLAQGGADGDLLARDAPEPRAGRVTSSPWEDKDDLPSVFDADDAPVAERSADDFSPSPAASSNAAPSSSKPAAAAPPVAAPQEAASTGGGAEQIRLRRRAPRRPTAEHLPTPMPQPASLDRRGRDEGRNSSPWLTVVLIAIIPLVLAAGAYFGWWVYSSRKMRGQLLQEAALARVGGVAAEMAGVATMLEQLPSSIRSTRTMAEVELLSALGWLVHRSGDPVTPTKANHPWGFVGARAAVAISAREYGKAHALLILEPRRLADRPVHRLLRAWAAWSEGDRERAERNRAEALSFQPRMALAHVLGGHLHREAGWLRDAQSSYRKALDHSPDLDIARLGLAAALMESGAPPDRFTPLLEGPADGRVGMAWLALLRAERDLRHGEKPVAIKELTDAVDKLPNEPAVVFHALEVLRLACNFKGASSAWQRLARVRGEDAAVRQLRARHLLAQGLERQAAAELERIESPTSRSRHLLAWVRLLQGDAVKARPLLSQEEGESEPLRLLAEAIEGKAAALAELATLAKESSTARIAFVRGLLVSGRPADAEREVLPLRQSFEHGAEAFTLLAAARLERGQPKEALEAVKQAHQRCAAFLAAEEQRGRAQLMLGQLDQAVQTLESVRKRGRANRALLSRLVIARLQRGEAGKITALLEELGRLPGSPALVRLVRGYQRLAQGAAKEAVDELNAAGNGLLARVGLGRALVLAGSAAADEVLLDVASRAKRSPWPLLELAEHDLRRDARRARRRFAAALSRARRGGYAPRVIARAQLGIARALLARRRRGAAVIAPLRAALAADPKNALAHRVMGQVQLQSRRLGAARRALQRSIELDPVDPTAHYLLGLALRGDRQGAKAAFRRFLELEPRGERARLVRRKLARLR